MGNLLPFRGAVSSVVPAIQGFSGRRVRSKSLCDRVIQTLFARLSVV